MSKTYETGHAKNVANFEKLISFIEGYGATYNPPATTLQLAALRTQIAGIKTTMSTHNAVFADYSNAVAAREVAFKPLPQLSTRILNFLKATDVTTQVIDNAKTNHLKLQGRRATAKLTEEQKKELLAQGKEVNQNSASQLSFDNQLNNFDKQIQLLASIPQYAPNETDLQVTGLRTLYTDLQTKNGAVNNQSTTISNARIARNQNMYDPETGIIATANKAKNYIKSLYGVTSPNYKQVSGLPFKLVKP